MSLQVCWDRNPFSFPVRLLGHYTVSTGSSKINSLKKMAFGNSFYIILTSLPHLPSSKGGENY